MHSMRQFSFESLGVNRNSKPFQVEEMFRNPLRPEIYSELVRTVQDFMLISTLFNIIDGLSISHKCWPSLMLYFNRLHCKIWSFILNWLIMIILRDTVGVMNVIHVTVPSLFSKQLSLTLVSLTCIRHQLISRMNLLVTVST